MSLRVSNIRHMEPDFPSDLDGDGLRRLAALGHNLSLPMDLEFHVAIPDESSAMKVAMEAARLGYLTDIWQDHEDHWSDPGAVSSLCWRCRCTKRLVPDYPAIVAIQEELDRIARPLGGYSDGWDSVGNDGDA
jgi:hypothetical protein